jgi:hypothetical protein
MHVTNFYRHSALMKWEEKRCSDIFYEDRRITHLGVFSVAFPAHKLQAHLLTAPIILVIVGNPFKYNTMPNVA